MKDTTQCKLSIGAEVQQLKRFALQRCGAEMLTWTQYIPSNRNNSTSNCEQPAVPATATQAIIDSMEANTQPILCCVGETVAGKPTQFIMERLFQSMGFDWRAITVEVAANELQAAISGIRAMRFHAVRLYSSVQQNGSELLVPQAGLSDTQRQHGLITSAMRSDAGWVGWHNLGGGIHDEFSRFGSAKETLCWLHGDSVRVQSAIRALPLAGYRSILRTGTQLAEPELKSVQSARRAEPHELDEVFASLAGHSRIVLIADNIQPEELESLRVAERIEPLSHGAVAADDATLHRLKKLIPGLHLMSEHEQVLSAEAYDFRRWTGQHADLALLRDAFEEFSAF